MAEESLRYRIQAIWEGGAATARASRQIDDVGDSTKKSDRGLRDWAKAAAVATGAAAGFVIAGREMFDALEEGAELELAASRFDNLARSIGTTADALLIDLRNATSNMVSDAELMQGANDLIQQGLVGSQEELLRMTTLVGELDWNMNVLGTTITNQSMMRLDALGLSAGKVKARFEELKAEGIAVQEAFTMALLEAGEEQLEVIGSSADSTKGDVRRLTTAWTNMRNEVVTEFAEEADLEQLTEDVSTLATAVTDLIGPMQELNRFAGTFQGIHPLFIGTEKVREGTRIIIEATSEFVHASEEQGVFTGGVERGTKAVEEQNEAVEEQATNFHELRRVVAQSDREMRLITDSIDEYAITVEEADEHTESYWRQIEEASKRVREAEKAQLATNAAFGQDFVQALDGANMSLDDFERLMVESAAAAGANAETLVAATLATGDYGDEVAEAAVKQAAMIAKAEELGQQLAEGKIDVDDAITALQDFQTELDRDYTMAFDTGEADAASDKLSEIEEKMVRLDNMQANVFVGVSGPGTSFMSGGTIGGVEEGAQFGASWTVGGRGGPDSQLVAFMATPGEQVDVSPPNLAGNGQQRPSYNFYGPVTVVQGGDGSLTPQTDPWQMPSGGG